MAFFGSRSMLRQLQLQAQTRNSFWFIRTFWSSQLYVVVSKQYITFPMVATLQYTQQNSFISSAFHTQEPQWQSKPNSCENALICSNRDQQFNVVSMEEAGDFHYHYKSGMKFPQVISLTRLHSSRATTLTVLSSSSTI